MINRWQTILAIDYDKHAAATYAANLPGVEVRCANMANEIDRLPYADVITGGFPCQPHSLAGKRKASADERDCGPDFVLAIAKVKPRMFLGENVKGLLSSENGTYLQRLLASMEDAGYVVQFRVLDAVNFGAPQFRSRVWFWGIRRDVYESGIQHLWPSPTHSWPWPETGGLFDGSQLKRAVTVGQALGIDDNARAIGAGRHDVTPKTVRDITNEPSVALVGQWQGHQQVEIEYRWSDEMYSKHPPASPASPASTVQAKWYKGGAEGLLAVEKTIASPSDTITNGGTETGGAEPIAHAKRQGYFRRLTPGECLRLMTAPDDFVFPASVKKTNQYKVIGNGWCSIMGHVFAQAFAKADPESRTVIDLFCGGGLGACGWHGRFWSYER